MRAKYVNENISYKRGSDPKDAMRIGLKEEIYSAMHDLMKIPGVLGLEYTHHGKRFSQSMRANKPKLKVRYIGSRYTPEIGGKPFWEATVNSILGKYVDFNLGNPDHDDFYFFIKEPYAETIREILEDDSKRGVNEAINFERGKDPKSAMGLGQWAKGYKVEYDPYGDKPHPPEMDVIDWADYNWDKSPGYIDSLEGATTVTEKIYHQLEKLPLVVFKWWLSLDENGQRYLGLFGNWIGSNDENFEFFDTPFVARVENDDEDRNFLVAPEGFNYARYVTELV